MGDEYADTGVDVDTHILPLMREHGIRWVQVARHGHREADGITVLEDSRQPTRAYLEGDYKLSDELGRNGTVPQFSGVHRCALKFKAFVIEQWLTENVRRSANHALGYNADETSRIANSEYSFERRASARVAFGFNVEETGRIERASEYDGLRDGGTPPAASSEKIAFGFNTEEMGRIERNAEYNTLSRTAFYPLLEWGWTRQQCIEYIRAAIGVTWKKSCCEHASLSLNPRGTLYKNQSLIQITTYSGNDAAVVAYRRKLASTPWALYRVRRIYNVNKKDPKKKGQADRAVELLAIISPTASHLILSRIANHLHSRIEEQHGIAYVYRERAGSTFPAREDFYVTAPAVVETKARYGIDWFDNKWAQRSLF